MEPLIDRIDAARVLNISERKLNRLVRTGQIPYRELPSGDIRFDSNELRQWADSYRRGSPIMLTS